MLPINEMYLLNMALELFAAVIMFILLLGCLLERRHFKQKDKLLIYMFLLQIGVLLSDAFYWFFLRPPVFVSIAVLQSLNLINYIFGCTLIALYAYYLVMHISTYTPISIWYARVIAIGCAVASFLWIISIFNGMYIYYDEKLEDYMGPLFWLSQLSAVILPGATMMIAFKYRKVLGIRDSLIMMSYGILPILSLPLQLFWVTTPLLLATTLSFVLVYTIIHMEESSRAAEQEILLAEKELELSENRISIMLSQIQPHFLYNALTTIKHLCGKQDPRAEDVVASFAKYLRGNMDSITNKRPIPFENELKHLDNYLAIECLRFPNVHFVYHLSVQNFSLPALTVQPIVENAIHYGITRRKNGAGTIMISSYEDEKAWYVTIEDDGVGYDPMQTQTDGRSHIGITNTRQRLEAMCHGTLEIQSIPNVGTTVRMILPKENE